MRFQTISQNAAIRQLFRFASVGVVSTLFYLIASLALAFFFKIDPVVSSVVAYILATFVSYSGQSLFTFQSAFWETSQILKFAVITAFGIAFSYFFVRWAQNLGFSYVMGMLLVCGAVPVASFLVMKFWVFTKV